MKVKLNLTALEANSLCSAASQMQDEMALAGHPPETCKAYNRAMRKLMVAIIKAEETS